MFPGNRRWNRWESLPSRGAWIEIRRGVILEDVPEVAPLAGSVDRNENGIEVYEINCESLPSRGAWIEM